MEYKSNTNTFFEDLVTCVKKTEINNKVQFGMFKYKNEKRRSYCSNKH